MREFDEIIDNDDITLYKCYSCDHEFIHEEVKEIRIESDTKDRIFCETCIDEYRNDPEFMSDDNIKIIGEIDLPDSDETYEDWVREMNTDFKRWNI
jgi:DNA-directed RNA polymerase subunit RPC12/RpoP